MRRNQADAFCNNNCSNVPHEDLGCPIDTSQLRPTTPEPTLAQNAQRDTVFQIWPEDREKRQRQEPRHISATTVAVPKLRSHQHDRRAAK